MNPNRSAAASRWPGVVVALLLGIVAGILLPVPPSWKPKIFRQFANQPNTGVAAADEAEESAEDAHSHEHDPDRVEVSDSVRASLGLSIEPLALDNYVGHFEVHGFVRELPGTQAMRVSSRYAGMISEVLATQGMPLRPGDPICRIQLVGEALTQAQTDLLETLMQMEIAATERARLEPLVDSGGVTGRRLLELGYEQQRLQVKAETRRQELFLRGLTLEQVQEIESRRQLIQEVTVFVPDKLLPPQLNLNQLLGDFEEQYFVESVAAKPGMFIDSGSDLVHLAFHEVLAVEGHAFEKDLPLLRELMTSGGTVDLSIGPEAMEVQIRQLKVAYLSNHADGDTNSFPFYVYFPNRSTVTAVEGGSGAAIESSRWKPGQRAHVHIPRQQFEGKFVLPREAVVLDGVRHLVFKRIPAAPVDPAQPTAHAHGDEYQPIEVRLLYQDRQVAVIEPSADLVPGDWIAKRGARHLYFAWQAQQAGGGGHGHDHDH